MIGGTIRDSDDVKEKGAWLDGFRQSSSKTGVTTYFGLGGFIFDSSGNIKFKDDKSEEECTKELFNIRNGKVTYNKNDPEKSNISFELYTLPPDEPNPEYKEKNYIYDC